MAPLWIRRRLSSRRVEELMLLQGVSGCTVRRRSPKRSGPLTRCGICQRPCRPLPIALSQQERWPTGNKVAYGLAVPCCHAVTPARFFGFAIPQQSLHRYHAQAYGITARGRAPPRRRHARLPCRAERDQGRRDRCAPAARAEAALLRQASVAPGVTPNMGHASYSPVVMPTGFCRLRVDQMTSAACRVLSREIVE
jgi:hypothetical protein